MRWTAKRDSSSGSWRSVRSSSWGCAATAIVSSKVRWCGSSARSPRRSRRRSPKTRKGCSVRPYDVPSRNMTEGDPASGRPKEWNASAYHVLSEPQLAWGLRVLERVRLTGGERVLDAGCGSGRVTDALASRVEHGLVVGCDLSMNMTRQAAKSLGDSPQAAVVCADLSMLPFRGAFDLIFS